MSLLVTIYIGITAYELTKNNNSFTYEITSDFKKDLDYSIEDNIKKSIEANILGKKIAIFNLDLKVKSGTIDDLYKVTISFDDKCKKHLSSHDESFVKFTNSCRIDINKSENNDYSIEVLSEHIKSKDFVFPMMQKLDYIYMFVMVDRNKDIHVESIRYAGVITDFNYNTQYYENNYNQFGKWNRFYNHYLLSATDLDIYNAINNSNINFSDIPYSIAKYEICQQKINKNSLLDKKLQREDCSTNYIQAYYKNFLKYNERIIDINDYYNELNNALHEKAYNLIRNEFIFIYK